MSKNQVRLLTDLLDQAFDKPAWHGTNFRNSVRGLKLSQLLWRPAPKRHCIWEVALHVAYWKYAVNRRIVGGKRGEFPRVPSNFPRIPPSPTLKDWRADLALLEETHAQLRKTIAALPENRMSQKAFDSGSTILKTVMGIASHDLYHAGQVQLLKRLQKK